MAAKKFLDHEGLLLYTLKVKDAIGKTIPANKTELDKIVSGDVEKWNEAAAETVPVFTNKDILDKLNVSAGKLTYNGVAVDTDTIQDLSNYITSTGLATQLTNYALKNNVYTKEEINGLLTSAMKYKGTVESWTALPTGATTGDMYNVTTASANNKAGDNVVWNGTSWDVMAGLVDLTGYVLETDFITNTQIEAMFA